MVLETHPIQYHAPMYRLLQQQLGIPVTAVYGSDFSVVGYRDPGFGTTFAWDTDLLSGYEVKFLSRVAAGSAPVVGRIRPRGLGRILSEAKPRAVLLVGYGPLFHQLAFLQVLRFGCPILLRCEARDRLKAGRPASPWYQDWLLRRFYRRCAGILYIGQRAQEHFKRLGVEDAKLVFSPYGVDRTSFQWDEAARLRWRQAARAELGIEEGKTAILFSGKLLPAKGVELLVGAVKGFPPELRERMILLFMGSGESQQRLARSAAAPPAIQVRFLGFKNQTEMSRYYHAADLLGFPSRSETWGLVVNEALHHGLPCVVSDSVGCAPDLVEEGATGEIFETGSEGSLAAAIQRVLNLVGRPEIREKCRQRVSSYTPERAAEGIARAYRAVLHDGGDSGA